MILLIQICQYGKSSLILCLKSQEGVELHLSICKLESTLYPKLNKRAIFSVLNQFYLVNCIKWIKF